MPIFHVKLQRMVSATAGLGLEAGLKQLDPPGVGRFVLYTKLQRTKRNARVIGSWQNHRMVWAERYFKGHLVQFAGCD